MKRYGGAGMIATGILTLIAAILILHYDIKIPALLGALMGALSIVAVLFLGGLAALILCKMAIGDIDLKYLIADENGDASLSRFQMLLFTFVIAGLYFLYALYELFAMKNSAGAVACAANLQDLVNAAAAKAQDAVTAQGASATAETKTAAEAARNAAQALASGCGGYSLPDIPATVLGLMGISGGSYLLSKGISAASAGNAAPGTAPEPAAGARVNTSQQ